MVDKDIKDRFWSKVNKTSTCWLWTAYIGKNRYGSFWVRRKSFRAHRFSWEIHYGKIPPGKVICHSCDNTKCVNPDHLFIGTQADNVKDMHDKNRAIKAKGSEAYKAKLNEEQVLEIRRSFKEKLTSRIQLALQYNVSAVTISYIVLRRTWKHI